MIRHAVYLAALLTSLVVRGPLMAEDALRRDFLCPPDSAKAWCYWWWLNGAASKEGITRDFEEMKKQGIGGAAALRCRRGRTGCAAGTALHERRMARTLQARRARGGSLRHRAGREPVQRLELRRRVGDA